MGLCARLPSLHCRALTPTLSSPHHRSLAIWYGIETAWLTFPSTSYSSSCLILAHATLLIGLWRTPTDPPVIPLAEGEPLLSPPLVSPPLDSPTSPILGARSPRLGRNNSYSKFR
jgi:hypothetical protein